jgi:ATP-dependent helicase/nuclease subunit B
LLLPFEALLPLAHRAFAARGGWMPRIETVHTLAASLGPQAARAPGELCFDRAMDGLQAAHLMGSRAWGAAWERRDPRGFAQAVGDVVRCAHAFAQGAAAQVPDRREAWWMRARDAVSAVAGPGATERLLAQVALEWAAQAAAPGSDRLFELRPSAWIVLVVGGIDPLRKAILEASATPVLAVDADEGVGDLTDVVPPAMARLAGFEDEATAAAAQVLAHLNQGVQPVALVAQDRLLVRRVRALLERQQVAMLDETGWTLSTTLAAARVMALLRAAAADADTDAVIAWLKAGVKWPSAVERALPRLEAHCRRVAADRLAVLRRLDLEADAAALRDAALGVLQPLMQGGARPFAVWLSTLLGALQACGALHMLRGDDAGCQVLATLGLDGLRPSTPALAAGAAAAMDLAAFTVWVDEALEAASYLPESGRAAAAPVVITPLSRAILRPFAAVVLPGADDRHLGAAPPTDSLLPGPLRAELGLPDAASHRQAQRLAFAHLLQLPRVTLLRRRNDGDDPLSESPLVVRLVLALARQGRSMTPWVDARVAVSLSAMPIPRSAAFAPALLPQRLSASACEALRTCPYRFFVLHMLGLREAEELDDAVEKRDYGTWLHAVLHEFHRTRTQPTELADEVARLLALGRATQAGQALSDEAFLPFAASFESLAPRYVAWLHERDAAGALWQAGELELQAAPDELEGVLLHGRLDRVDRVQDADATVLELIDYKTGSADALKRQVREPFEDTQLSFYAALMGDRSDAPLHASYLALDGSQGIVSVPHRDVQRSAAALVQGLAHDLRRLRDGARLTALGEGASCEHCEARGMCRRDHWSQAGDA